jgi:hypothetical protein
MSAFVKFSTFSEALAEAGHNLGSDTLKVALSNTAPTAATDTVFDAVTKHPPPTEDHGYTAAGHTITVSASSQTAGTYKLVCTDVVITATAGGIGPFRYAVIYNDTSATDLLVCYFDYGSSITLAAGETLTVDFDGTNGLLQLV